MRIGLDVTPAGGSMYSKPARNGTAACAPWGAYDGCVEGDWGCTECLSGSHGYRPELCAAHRASAANCCELPRNICNE